MKDRIGIGICALAVLIALISYESQQSYRSTTIAGPEFHSQRAGDAKTVYSELSKHLAEMGFAPLASPSQSDSWSGMHTKDATRIWFVRRESRSQATYVYADIDEIAVRTSIKWEARGFERQLESVERLAYSTALDLDTWLAGLKEPNGLPGKLREEKRRKFERHLAANRRS